jgi:hypothetical protein
MSALADLTTSRRLMNSAGMSRNSTAGLVAEPAAGPAAVDRVDCPLISTRISPDQPREWTPPTFAARALDLDPGDALQGFAHVLVGEFAHVFGGNGVHHLIRITLCVQRIGKALANAADDDVGIGGGGLRTRQLRKNNARQSAADADEHRQRWAFEAMVTTFPVLYLDALLNVNLSSAL